MSTDGRLGLRGDARGAVPCSRGQRTASLRICDARDGRRLGRRRAGAYRVRRLRGCPAGRGDPVAAAGRRVPARAHRTGRAAPPVLSVSRWHGSAVGRLADTAAGDRRQRDRVARRAGGATADQRGRAVGRAFGRALRCRRGDGGGADPAARDRRERGAQSAGRSVPLRERADGASAQPTRRWCCGTRSKVRSSRSRS